MRGLRLLGLASLAAAMLTVVAASVSARTNNTNNTNNSNNTQKHNKKDTRTNARSRRGLLSRFSGPVAGHEHRAGGARAARSRRRTTVVSAGWKASPYDFRFH